MTGSQDSQYQATLISTSHGHNGDEKRTDPGVGFFLPERRMLIHARERRWKFLDGATVCTKIVGIVIQILCVLKSIKLYIPKTQFYCL